MRSLLRLVPLVALTALVAGCGIPLQTSPERLDVEVAVPTAAPRDVIGATGSTVYLVSDDGLVRVARDRVDEPDRLLDLLVRGPTPEESQRGLRSAIPPRTMVAVDVESGRAAVTLSRDFAAIGGNEEILAVAQIVLSLDAGGIDEVLVLLEGEPTPMPLPDGELVDRPVTASDYADLVVP